MKQVDNNNGAITLHKFNEIVTKSSSVYKQTAPNSSSINATVQAAVSLAAVVAAATVINNYKQQKMSYINKSFPSSLQQQKQQQTPESSSSTNQEHKFRFIIEFSAGALGGIVSRTATAPIDRLRTIFQVQSVEQSRNEINVKKIWYYMLKEGKWQSLWRGNLVNCLKTAPENAIRLATYEKLKSLLNSNRNNKITSIQEKLACGSAAGFIATLILYPLKTVKTVMNLGSTGEFKSIADCINKIYKQYGARAFYRGLPSHVIAIIPSAGVDLAVYETLKQTYSQFRNKTEPNVFEKIILGNLSSGLGNLIVYPLFFARTRLQSNRNQSETTCNVLLHVWRKDGLPGMYRGFLLHILKIGPAASISYVTFEAVTKMFSINSLA